MRAKDWNWRLLNGILVLGATLLPMTWTHAGSLPQALVPSGRSIVEDLNPLITEVSLDSQQIADAVNLYESGDDIFLPVGDLSRILTLSISLDPEHNSGSGFLVDEANSFSIDTDDAVVKLGSRREGYDRSRVRWIDGELYVTSDLLQKWWPIDFRLDHSALSLKVMPRVTLPIQARRQREQMAKRLRGRNSAYRAADYPTKRVEYKMFDGPFIDNTVSAGVSRQGSTRTSAIGYTGYATADLLAMEAAVYAAIGGAKQESDIRLTLSRNDPDAKLLGPLAARSVALGNVSVPTLPNVIRGAADGNGVMISNRPLDLSSSYGLQTLRGELLPGWDVTLYYNDALIAYQQSRPDGRYEFADLPLGFGRNEFRLVFQGPLGQSRVERQVFELDDLQIKPGKLNYMFAGQQGAKGLQQVAQFDYGLTKSVAVSLAQAYTDHDHNRPAQTFVSGGVRVAAFGSLINIGQVHDLAGGRLTALGVRGSRAGIAIDASRTWADGFESDFFTTGPNGYKIRDAVRATGVIQASDRVRLPYAFEFSHDQTNSGQQLYGAKQRISFSQLGTNFTSALDWRQTPEQKVLDGMFQASRRLGGVGLNGQVRYRLSPESQIRTASLFANRSFGENNFLSLGLSHDFMPDQTSVTLGANRNFGDFAFGVNALYGGENNMGVGLVLFTSLGRDPRSGQMVQDWRPMASMGTVSAQAFVDANQNGQLDPGEEPIERAAFTLNGASRNSVRTGKDGTAMITRLPVRSYTDIALDLSTLDDAQWQPTVAGVRVLPRPGRAQRIDFPVVLTAEIDGTAFLQDRTSRHGIGNALVELINVKGQVAASARSASDGFFLITGVRPGDYMLRVSSEQAKGLNLNVSEPVPITINARADFISGTELTLKRMTQAE